MDHDSIPVIPLHNFVTPPYSAGLHWREQSSIHTHIHTHTIYTHRNTHMHTMGRKYSLWRREESTKRAHTDRECRESERELKGFKSSVMWRMDWLLVLLCVMWDLSVWIRGVWIPVLLFIWAKEGNGCWIICWVTFLKREIGNSHVNVWQCNLNEWCMKSLAISRRWKCVWCLCCINC